MKIKKECQIRQVAGESIFIMQREQQADLTRILIFTPSSVWLWEQLKATDFTEAEAIDLLLSKYEVDKDTAATDVRSWVESLRQYNLLEV